MEKKKHPWHAAITSLSGKELNRGTLKEAFSKFGAVNKIFIAAPENTFAKVYLDDLESTKLASTSLNGFNNWGVEFTVDVNKGRFDRNLMNANSVFVTQQDSVYNPNWSTSSVNSDAMDEEFVYAGQYVDIHGRPVEVLQSESRQLFVNLDDVRAAGFNIFPKDSYNNATIPKEMEIAEFENYLLNQGKKYIIDFKKTFNENDIVRVFEKVRARLQNSDTGSHVGLGRQINNTGNSKNFSITAKTTVNPVPQASPSPTAKANVNPVSNCPENGTPQNSNYIIQTRNRPVKRLPPNFQPSHRSFQNKPTQNVVRNELGRDAHDRKEALNRSSENNADKQRNGKNVHSKHPGKLPKSGGFVPKQNVSMQTSVDKEESWDNGSDMVAASTSRSNNSLGASVAAKEKIPLTVQRLKLAAGSKHKMVVSYTQPDKPNILCAQQIESLNSIEDILIHVNTIDNNLPIVTPVRDMLCVALFEDVWYRVVVLDTTASNTFVELIDYGNKEYITTPLREMSAEMKAIPAQANRFTTTQLNNESNVLEVGQELEALIKKQFVDSTYLIELTTVSNNADQEAKVTSETPSPEVSEKSSSSIVDHEYFTELPASTAKLLPDESVMVLYYNDTHLVLRNKQTGGICKKVYEHLNEMEKKPITTPKVGQLVLCAKDTHAGLHRAIIKEISDSIAEVEFVDYQGGDFVSLKYLHNFDAILASHPSATLTLEYPVLSQMLGDECEAFLNQIILQKIKLKTTKVNGKIDLILPKEDNMLLSDKLKQLSEPKPAPKPTAKSATKPAALASPVEAKTKEVTKLKEKVENVAENKSSSNLVASADVPVISPKETISKDGGKFIEVRYTDMSFVSAPLGLASYYCYSCQDGMVTLLSTSEKHEEYLEKVLVMEESADNTPYEPAFFVMCLAKFQDAWFRAFVTDNHDDQVAVFFVDFGNTELIDKSEIRRFPKQLAEIPLLGITAVFSGIPNKPNVHKRLTELIPDDSILEVDVKQSNDDDEFKCVIEIPSIFNKLKEEALI